MRDSTATACGGTIDDAHHLSVHLSFHLLNVSFFFFSSRRRHTRSLCDWSSDVCSSDLSKRISSDSAAHSQLIRFEREAQATALLRSPHSIRLFDFGTADDGSFYYVMEMLEGRDLETVVREFGPLPPERVVYLLRQICHSLAEAHARGMVHRDIKPANLFLCRLGLEFDFVKVLDFGLVQTRKI